MRTYGLPELVVACLGFSEAEEVEEKGGEGGEKRRTVVDEDHERA